MGRVRIPFSTQFYPARYAPAGSTQLVNMSIQRTPEEAKTPLILERSDGIKPWAELRTLLMGLGLQPSQTWRTDDDVDLNATAWDVRGMIRMKDSIYVLVESNLYRIDAAGQPDPAAEVNPGDPIDGQGRVSMAQDGDYLMIVTSAGTGYTYRNSTATFAQITHADFPPADWVTWMDQYFIVGNRDSSYFQISALGDPTVWNAIDIASAESNPDKLVAGVRDHRDLILFGTDTAEIWYNSGDGTFPFERAPDGLIECGLAAQFSVGAIDNTPIWLGLEKGGRSVRRMNGRSPARISTPAMDDEFDAYGDVSDAFAMTWSRAGRAFYALTFPSQFVTWVYDASVQLWHRRRSWESSRWRVSAVEDAFGYVIALDALSLALGTLDRDYHAEWTDPMEWQAFTAPVVMDRRLMTFTRVELEIDPGRGLVETVPPTQGQEPLLWLSWSDDDGRTWSNEYKRSMGLRGKYRTRLVWTNCGASRGRVFRIRGADPIPSALIGMWADVTVGV